MYEWVEKVNKAIQGFTGEINNHKTRVTATQLVMDILNEYKIKARVDCGNKVNTPEVVEHGGFMLVVETLEIIFTFKYNKKEAK